MYDREAMRSGVQQFWDARREARNRQSGGGVEAGWWDVGMLRRVRALEVAWVPACAGMTGRGQG